jgi:hypothetical protein
LQINKLFGASDFLPGSLAPSAGFYEIPFYDTQNAVWQNLSPMQNNDL